VDFTGSTAGLLIPWVALFAQLARQTGSRRGDTLSVLISIGSPAWIFSSISLAVLYQHSVRSRLNRLRHKLSSGSSAAIFLHLADRCKAAQTVLLSFLQAPIRLSTRTGYLSSLIALPENHWWWIDADKSIKTYQRKVDLIFIAQSAAAASAWVLAIVGDFTSVPGETASANSSEWQICMGTLWLWLVSNRRISPNLWY
jgi:hypothetical protein